MLIENGLISFLAFFTIAWFAIKILTAYMEIKNEQYEEDLKQAQKEFHQRFQHVYDELYSKKMANAYQMNQYRKWFQLEQSSRNKILKVKTLAERGEAGEKDAAKNRYLALLKKHNLTLLDVPVGAKV